MAIEPPGVGVGVDALGHAENVVKSLHLGRLLGRIELQDVEVLEVERDGSLVTVDLERVLVLASAGEAGGFERSERAALESCEQNRRVVHRYLRFARGAGCDRALLDEGLERSRNFGNLAAQIAAEVDDVGSEVAQRAAAGGLGAEAPDQVQVGRHGPILQVAGAKMIDLPQPSFLDQLLGKRD